MDVRVLKCDERLQGNSVVQGYNFVASNVKERGGLAVANASLGAVSQAPLSVVYALNALRNAGVLLVDAAGNNGVGAHQAHQAQVPSTLTVASIKEGDIIFVQNNRNTINGDFEGSNWGPCVDIFAPGVDIVSARLNSGNGSVEMTGTSMAGKRCLFLFIFFHL